MRKVALVLLAVVLVASVAMAQDAPAVNAGSKSLNFSFAGLGTFGVGAAGIGFGTTGIGLSYFMDKDAALRFGLNVGIGSTKTPAAVTGNSDAKTSAMDIGFGVDYLMYTGTGRLRPYMGAGIAIAMGSSTNEPSVTPAINGETTKITNNRPGQDGLGFGLMGVLGAEFFLYNEISLSAEYMPTLVSIGTAADSETSVEGAATTTSKGASSTNIFGFGSTSLQLHIYW